MTEQEWEDKLDEVQKHSENWYNKYKQAEEKIADIKANCDYVLEGKDLEIKQLGERCNQLLKDKGNLTDELQELKETLAQTIENDEVSYETLKLHDQEEIGMLNSRIAELKQQIEKMKCFTNCNYSENSSCLLNNEKKEECKGCQYWRLRKMKSEIEMKVNIKDVENHIKQLEEQCEDWKADHKHNLELMKGLNNRIADLEEELKNWKDEWQEQVQKAIDEGYARTLQTIQLTKAKEIIKEFARLEYADYTDGDYSNELSKVLEQAEQFIKEIEK